MKAYGSIIKRNDRHWDVTNDVGYSLKSLKTKAGAVRIARDFHTGKPIHVFEQGPMFSGRAELRLVEIIPAR